MKVGVTKEVVANERRVALAPEAIAKLTKAGFEIAVEAGAGEHSFYSDAQYEKAGATIVRDRAQLYKQSDIIAKVQPPTDQEVGLLASPQVLIALLAPAFNTALVNRLTLTGVTALSMDAIPRIARAQSMDVLSSQSSLAGYKAVLLAASTSPKFLPMMTTAAGTIPPAKVLVLGAGVAGLQAIATARRLGAVVEAFDVRPVVKEQVESLGAKFLMLEIKESTESAGGYAKELSEETHRREMELVHGHAKTSDIIITTAQIPGRKAPILVTREMVKDMAPGAVIIDLAAETGGNCELTKAGETVVDNGVSVIGPINLPSSVPMHASHMYSRNVQTLLLLLVKEGKLNLDFKDEVIASVTITHQGAVRQK